MICLRIEFILQLRMEWEMMRKIESKIKTDGGMLCVQQ